MSSGKMRPSSAGSHLQEPTLSQIKALRVECTTWSRDSHGLFDYEARHVNVKKFVVTKSARLFRINAQIECVSESAPVPSATPQVQATGEGECGVVSSGNAQEATDQAGSVPTVPQGEGPQNTDFLLSIRRNCDGKYVVIPADRSLCGNTPSVIPQKLWSIVRDQNNNKHVLQENDVIKLGRYKLRVKQLVNHSPKREDDVSEQQEVPELRLEDGDPRISHVAPDDMQCRICLLEGNQEGDPLISPCDCKGSIKFVHLECLRHWINGRLNFSGMQQRPFFVKQIQCELCKIPYPVTIRYNSERMQVVNVPRTEPPFIVLENMVGNQQKGVYVISMMSQKDLKLGRGHESDVRIPDVSISRYHATIRFVDGSFQLEDHNSKFGTLVSLRKSFCIGDSAAAVQVGRSVVKFFVDGDLAPPDEIADVSDVASQNQHQIHDAGQSESFGRCQNLLGDGVSSEGAVGGGDSHSGGASSIQNPDASGCRFHGYEQPFLGTVRADLPASTALLPPRQLQLFPTLATNEVGRQPGHLTTSGSRLATLGGGVQRPTCTEDVGIDCVDDRMGHIDFHSRGLSTSAPNCGTPIFYAADVSVSRPLSYEPQRVLGGTGGNLEQFAVYGRSDSGPNPDMVESRGLLRYEQTLNALAATAQASVDEQREERGMGQAGCGSGPISISHGIFSHSEGSEGNADRAVADTGVRATELTAML